MTWRALSARPYCVGLFAAPLPGVSPMVTGLSAKTLRDNWSPAYTDGRPWRIVLSPRPRMP
jgi:hypothetical protein